MKTTIFKACLVCALVALFIALPNVIKLFVYAVLAPAALCLAAWLQEKK